MKDEAARAELIAKVAEEMGVQVSPRAVLPRTLTPLPLGGPWTRYCANGCGNRVHQSSNKDTCRDCRRHEREAIHPRPPWSPAKAPPARPPPPAEQPMAQVVSMSRRRQKQLRDEAKFQREAPLRERLRESQVAEHTIPTCRSLWAAVLVQAVVDYGGGGFYGSGGLCNFDRLKAEGEREAREWFASPYGYVGSFEWICGQLELDSVVLREKLTMAPALRRQRKLIRDPRNFKETA